VPRSSRWLRHRRPAGGELAPGWDRPRAWGWRRRFRGAAQPHPPAERARRDSAAPGRWIRPQGQEGPRLRPPPSPGRIPSLTPGARGCGGAPHPESSTARLTPCPQEPPAQHRRCSGGTRGSGGGTWGSGGDEGAPWQPLPHPTAVLGRDRVGWAPEGSPTAPLPGRGGGAAPVGAGPAQAPSLADQPNSSQQWRRGGHPREGSGTHGGGPRCGTGSAPCSRPAARGTGLDPGASAGVPRAGSCAGRGSAASALAQGRALGPEGGRGGTWGPVPALAALIAFQRRAGRGHERAGGTPPSPCHPPRGFNPAPREARGCSGGPLPVPKAGDAGSPPALGGSAGRSGMPARRTIVRHFPPSPRD